MGGSAEIGTLFGFVNPYELLDDPLLNYAKSPFLVRWMGWKNCFGWFFCHPPDYLSFFFVQNAINNYKPFTVHVIQFLSKSTKYVKNSVYNNYVFQYHDLDTS